MNPKKIKKLTIKKEVISRLDRESLSSLKGGTDSTDMPPVTTTYGITVGNCDINTISDPGCGWQTEAWYCIIGCV